MTTVIAKKIPEVRPVPTLVLQRLVSWGACVRKQRVAQNIRAADLCVRMGITRPTLTRLESGNVAISAATYLTALHVLGIADQAAPEIPAEFWRMDMPAARARPAVDDEYF